MTTRSRFAALSEQDRALWLDPAETEFCASGYENASLNRILSRAGVSKGRSYHYFADKGELYRATLERRLSRIAGLDQDAALNAKTAAGFTAEIASLCARLTLALQHDLALAELLRTLHREPAAQKAFAEPLAQLHQRIGALLTAGQSLGAVRSDLPLSLLTDVALQLIATIDRWFAQNADELSNSAETDLSERALDLLIAPLRPTQTPERPQT